MIILEALQTVLVTVVIGYLSITNTLADALLTILPGQDEVVAITENTREEEVAGTTSPITELSRLYAKATETLTILKSDTRFQAALQGAAQSASVRTSVKPESPISADDVSRALVNIFCEYKTDRYIRTTTGSGFFIDRAGVILTNAHVAQFLLLEDTPTTQGETDCVIRAGDPATPEYTAELLFISPTWIRENAHQITSEAPRGTGEFDYALLYVSSSRTEKELPETFPALPIHTDLIPRTIAGTMALTGGYPAEKLFRESAHATLTPAVAATEIEDLYTFGSNYADIFTVSTSPVGEQGVSGGPVVIPKTGAVGLVVTKGDSGEEGDMSLRALTLSYIDRTITDETGYSLFENAQGELAERALIFKEAMIPYLAKLLVFELEN